jgi:AP2-like factor, ANT lineage
MSSNNGSNNGGSANNGGTNAAASGWLGFSLSPHMASSMDDQQQHGLFFSSAAYGLGAGDGAVASSGGPYYTPQLASMPLKSDGSLCIMEALQRRTDQQDHHGMWLLLCFSWIINYWVVIYIYIYLLCDDA